MGAAWEASGFALPARLGSCLLACAVNIFDVPMQLEHKADLAVDMSEFLIVTLHGFEHAQRWSVKILDMSAIAEERQSVSLQT